MSKVKKKSYQHRSKKGCRKKAVSGGKCEKHAKKEKVSSAPVATKKKFSLEKGIVKSVCFEIGVFTSKIHSLFSTK